MEYVNDRVIVNSGFCGDAPLPDIQFSSDKKDTGETASGISKVIGFFDRDNQAQVTDKKEIEKMQAMFREASVLGSDEVLEQVFRKKKDFTLLTNHRLVEVDRKRRWGGEAMEYRSTPWK